LVKARGAQLRELIDGIEAGLAVITGNAGRVQVLRAGVGELVQVPVGCHEHAGYRSQLAAGEAVPEIVAERARIALQFSIGPSISVDLSLVCTRSFSRCSYGISPLGSFRMRSGAVEAELRRPHTLCPRKHLGVANGCVAPLLRLPGCTIACDQATPRPSSTPSPASASSAPDLESGKLAAVPARRRARSPSAAITSPPSTWAQTWWPSLDAILRRSSTGRWYLPSSSPGRCRSSHST